VVLNTIIASLCFKLISWCCVQSSIFSWMSSTLSCFICYVVICTKV